MTVAAALTLAANTLSDAGLTEPQREASSLLAFALAKDRTFLIAHPEYELKSHETARFLDLVSRRSNREPFQHITGKQEFYGLEFIVSPAVLIPRPETEILVEAAIDLLSPLDSPTFCELGLGSGCISVSILHEVRGAIAVGVDVSSAALGVAMANSSGHGVSQRLTIVQGDLFDNIDGIYDLIVSNPPYVPDRDQAELQPEVRDFEPPSALFAGSDGLDIVRRIVADSPAYLNSGAFLLMEIGFGQCGAVAKLFNDEIWEHVEFLPDLQRIDRVVKVRKK